MKILKGRPILFFLKTKITNFKNTYLNFKENIKTTVLTKNVTTGAKAEFQP